MKKLFKKRWRRWRRAIWTCVILLLAGVAIWSGQSMKEQMKHLLTGPTDKRPLAVETMNYLQIEEDKEEDRIQQQRAFMQQLNKSKTKKNVHLRTSYVCGVEEQDMGRLSADGVYELMNRNPLWQGRFDDHGDVWLEQTVSDLSPACKRQAYMSVDMQGNLTLFDGPPEEEKVLRTFFQLDVGSMESSLPQDVVKQLEEGIRIQDIEEYNSVLSTFSDYARDMSENVMKRNP
ncbi:BofC C-terminal domain-containing protein [Paenibacillus sp. JCM 10914]